MANETGIFMASLGAPALGIFEPYVDPAILEQLSSMDAVLVSILLIVLSFIAASIAFVAIAVIGKHIAKKTQTELDDLLLQATQQPVLKLIILGGFYLAILNLAAEMLLAEVFLNITATLAYLVIITYVLTSLDIVVKHGRGILSKKTDNSLNDEIIPILHKAAKVVVWAFGLILILGAWGVDVGPFLAGLGIAGLAVSFALQGTLSNIFAGISLILDKTFKIGDKVQLDSGELGVIHEVSLRSTRLKTYNNEVVVIPNSVLASARIKNFTQPDLKIRVVVPFSVEYGTEPRKVISTVEGAIRKEIKDIMEDPPVSVVFSEMGASSLNFQAWIWVEHYAMAYSKQLEATELIYRTLNKAGIGIPFPTQTLYVRKQAQK